MNLAKVIYNSYPSSDLLVGIDPEKDTVDMWRLSQAVKHRNRVGDGLFTFIVDEIHEAAGNSPQEALRLLQNAKRDIEAVIDGILYQQGVEASEAREPSIDDTVHFCPECERPNQFGEICDSCSREIAMED